LPRAPVGLEKTRRRVGAIQALLVKRPSTYLETASFAQLTSGHGSSRRRESGATDAPSHRAGQQLGRRRPTTPRAAPDTSSPPRPPPNSPPPYRLDALMVDAPADRQSRIRAGQLKQALLICSWVNRAGHGAMVHPIRHSTV